MEPKNFIRHIIEPKVLKLIWQAPSDPTRKRLLVAKLYNNSGNVSLQYLTESNDYREAINLGFSGYSAFTLDRDQYNDVLQSFSRRLPPDKREDFAEYLQGFRIPPEESISTFALLGYTGAKLPSDTFSVINTFDEINGPFEFLLEATEFRDQGIDNKEIAFGKDISFEKEFNTDLQETAIKIMYADRKIGHVTRALIPNVLNWLESGRIKRSVIEKFNGTKDKPTLYIYVEVI